MIAQRSIPEMTDTDQRVVLTGMAWQDFEALLAIRGERAGVRMYYLDGAIEIMSPTKFHENNKKKLARLLEAWAVELGVDLEGFGSWTLKKEIEEAGAEPDECYTLGEHAAKDVPDFAIEIEWSRTLGLDKREIYRRLGVRELWTLKADGKLVVRVRTKGEWGVSAKSKLLPKLDLVWLVGFLDVPTQLEAVRSLQAALRSSKSEKKKKKRSRR